MNYSISTQFWKNYFQVYDSLLNFIPYQELLGEIIESLGNVKGKNVLDVGSGTGNLSVKLTNESEARVTSVDFSEEGLNLHRTKDPKATLQRVDITAGMPFSDNAFDAAVCNNVLYTIAPKDRIKVLKEIFRVLVPGGRLVVVNPKIGINLVAIYLDHIKKDFKRRGFKTTVGTVVSLIIPTAKMFYYNILLRKASGSISYKYFDEGEQFRMLDAVFEKVFPTKVVYSGQAYLDVGIK